MSGPEIVQFVLGVAVLVVVTTDFLLTTIGSAGRFTVSDRIGRATFGGLRALSRLGGARVLTEVSGAVVLVAVAGFWILGAWLGWTMIYASVPGSLQMEAKGVEPSWFDHGAHVGHLLSTLGGATTKPQGTGWNVVGVLVGLNGMIMLTLAVSFLLTTRQTLQQGRAFAALVGSGPVEVDRHVDRLGEVLSGLHSSPFALWYGHARPDRRLPDAMLAFAQQAESIGGPTAERVRDLLGDLPHWEAAEADGFLDRMSEWAERHRLMGEGEPSRPNDGRATVP